MPARIDNSCSGVLLGSFCSSKKNRAELNYSYFKKFNPASSPKANEPKKKGAGNDNFSLFWQNAFGVTLPKKAEVRAISVLPPHVSTRNYC
jgi:hypothetical protein